MAINFIQDFFALFYPRLCLACGHHLPPRQELFCLTCQYKLPQTKFHLQQENPLVARFWGRLPLEAGGALFHFVKGGRTQQLIHNLKYRGKKQIGLEVGKLYGNQLKEVDWFQSIDLIVPVPLHPKKERQRGFNQSDLFAQGLSIGLDKPWEKNALRRKHFTHTQTKKGKMDRFENVLEAFEVGNQEKLAGKSILLVDDVITTGATLEACGTKILEVAGTRLSIATIAMAED